MTVLSVLTLTEKIMYVSDIKFMLKRDLMYRYGYVFVCRSSYVYCKLTNTV
jgi:hypothetical protein